MKNTIHILNIKNNFPSIVIRNKNHEKYLRAMRKTDNTDMCDYLKGKEDKNAAVRELIDNHSQHILDFLISKIRNKTDFTRINEILNLMALSDAAILDPFFDNLRKKSGIASRSAIKRIRKIFETVGNEQIRTTSEFVFFIHENFGAGHYMCIARTPTLSHFFLFLKFICDDRHYKIEPTYTSYKKRKRKFVPRIHKNILRNLRLSTTEEDRKFYQQELDYAEE